VFAAWGRFVYRWRWATLVMSAALLGLSVVGLLAGGNLGIGNSARNGLEYARADNLISEQLSTGRPAGASFLLTFASKDLPAADPAFRSQVEAALAPIQHAPRVTGVHTPYDAPSPAAAQSFVSTDGHQALVRVDLKATGNQASADYAALRDRVDAGRLTVTATGQVPINHAFNTTLESDLRRAETVSLPVALILLLVIFGSVVAAALPLGVGVLTIVAGLGGTFLLSRVTDVTQYALNVVTLIGSPSPSTTHFSSSPGIGTSSRPAPVRVMRWRRPWPPRAGRSCSPASRSRSGSRRCSSTRAPKRILVL
jgi:putative drug exporter of the RND superfamily